jgi:hypothetical protein
MAQYRIDTKQYLANGTTIFEANLQADRYGNVLTPGATSTSAFGEPVSVPITPVVQLDGLYGIQDRDFESLTANTATVVAANNLMEVRTGTGESSLAVLRSRRAVRYRAGQGAMCRFTAKYTTTTQAAGIQAGPQGYFQFAGFTIQGQQLGIGFNPANGKFGILRQNGFKAQIESLTLQTGATSAGNVTITLPESTGATDYVVPLTDTGGDAALTAAEISEYFQANALTSANWTAEHVDGVVNFVRVFAGPVVGTKAFVDTDSTGTTDTFTTIQTGANGINDWTYQEDWNDPLDGTGISGINIDARFLNVFQINFRWLGAGIMQFAIENPLSGDIYCFHKEIFTNTLNVPHFDNPTMKLGYIARHVTGSAGTDVSVCGGSFLGAVEGLIEPTQFPTAISTAGSYNPALAKNADHHVLTLHNRIVFNDRINTREVILKNISISGQVPSAKGSLTVTLFYNFDDIPAPAGYTLINSTQSSSYYTDVNGTVTVGTNVPIFKLTIPLPGVQDIDLTDYRIVIPPNNEVTVVVRATGATISDLGCSLTWIED